MTSRLPVPGQDDGTWGDVLNDFLSVEHAADGSLKIRSDGTVAPLQSGTVPARYLGTGVPGTGNFLRGDGTWTAPPQPTVGTTAGTVAAGDDSRITGAVQKSTVTAKGDLLVGTGTAAVSRLGVGGDGLVLTADSTKTAGAKWAPFTGSEVLVALGSVSGAITIDLTQGSAFSMTLTGNAALTFSNAAAGKVTYATLRVTQGGAGGYTLTITGAQASFGTQPTLSSTVGNTDKIACESWDGGAHWDVALTGQAIA